jgi:hypothetical protein
MHSSRLAAVFAAGALVVAGLATSTAAAASAPTVRDTVRVANNLDTGNNGYWAWLNFSRTTTITKTVDRVNEADTYQVELADSGTLRTIRGARSPEAGVRIAHAMPGSVAGRYSVTVTSEVEPSDERVSPYANYRCRPDSTPDRAQDCSGMPKSTGDWYQLYFGDNATPVQGSESYSWTYRTCSERWVDNGVRGQGDITGERCERAVRPESPTVAQPECGAEKGKLVIPADRGVFYKVRTADRSSRVVRAGSYDVRPGTYWVTAHAVRGYELRGDRMWRLVVEQAEVCPTPTPTPTVTVTPTVDPTPDPEPTPTVTETETEEPTPAPTVTTTSTRVIVVNEVRVPDRVDTGLGGLATK